MELLLIISLLIAFYIAWSIGSNDETMATLAGSGFISVTFAALIGALMDFLGAVLVGHTVEKTIGGGLIAGNITLVDVCIILLAVATWLIVGSYRGWPISTTHSVVGAAIGLGILKFGWTGIKWQSLSRVILGWIISPIVGLIGSMLFYYIASHLTLPRVRGLRGVIKLSRYSSIFLLVWTSYTAFFRGANDIANATAFLSVLYGQSLLIRAICGIGMALGLLVFGRRVIRSVGVQLVELNPFSALCVQISVAITLCVGTLLGLPLSGTHVLVSAILGLGLARHTWINLRGVFEIFVTWIITFPSSAALSILFSLLVGYLHI
ncbi:MAG: hypothetical protein DRJ49_00270 [Thermoprotei archaeon]|nr:MAG: hypothetical protein DRJ49_00270 [Thermoprotei archaeon]